MSLFVYLYSLRNIIIMLFVYNCMFDRDCMLDSAFMCAFDCKLIALVF